MDRQGPSRAPVLKCPAERLEQRSLSVGVETSPRRPKPCRFATQPKTNDTLKHLDVAVDSNSAVFVVAVWDIPHARAWISSSCLESLCTLGSACCSALRCPEAPPPLSDCYGAHGAWEVSGCGCTKPFDGSMWFGRARLQLLSNYAAIIGIVGAECRAALCIQKGVALINANANMLTWTSLDPGPRNTAAKALRALVEKLSGYPWHRSLY